MMKKFIAIVALVCFVFVPAVMATALINSSPVTGILGVHFVGDGFRLPLVDRWWRRR